MITSILIRLLLDYNSIQYAIDMPLFITHQFNNKFDGCILK